MKEESVFGPEGKKVAKPPKNKKVAKPPKNKKEKK